MSWFSEFLHPQEGYKAAEKQLQGYYGDAQGYLNPYNQYGQQSGSDVYNTYKSLLDPQALQDKFSRGYQESDYAKDLEGQATQHGLNAASSMGMLGSSPALQAIQAGTSNIYNADKQQYMDDLMKKYLSGAQMVQGMYNTGAQAGGQMSNTASQMGQDMGKMEYGAHTAGASQLGSMAGGLAGIIESYLAGGGKIPGLPHS